MLLHTVMSPRNSCFNRPITDPFHYHLQSYGKIQSLSIFSNAYTLQPHAHVAYTSLYLVLPLLLRVTGRLQQRSGGDSAPPH